MKNSGIDEIISKRNKADAALDSATLIEKLLNKPKDTERFKKIVEANVKNLELALTDNIEFTEEQRQKITDSVESGNDFIGVIKHIMPTGTYTITITPTGSGSIMEKMIISDGSLTLQEFRINDELILTGIVLSEGKSRESFFLSATINSGEFSSSLETESYSFEKNKWSASVPINRITYDITIDYKPVEEIKHIDSSGEYSITITPNGFISIGSEKMVISDGSLTLQEFRINDGLILTGIVLSGGTSKGYFFLSATINSDKMSSSLETESYSFEKNKWSASVPINEITYDITIDYKPDKNPPLDPVKPKL
jgi:hypothetical protein